MANAVVRTVVNGVKYAAVTNASGEFTLSDMPQGTGYAIEASKAGYQSNTAAGIVVTDKQTTSGVTIVLAEEVEPEPTPTTPAPPVTPQPTPTTQVVKVDLKQGAMNDKDHTITVNALPTAGATGIVANIEANRLPI
ncbi:carboxypeptidase-like regulatory domain-containing protein [Paenibacillus sp. NRS-1760]|uniref:carboxypeptidase-like regulatory domain-containing protein n=1 Tax=Paenibacillus sp. NRS-1760 TaxID=3233902 RepID=UPI003D26C769